MQYNFTVPCRSIVLHLPPWGKQGYNGYNTTITIHDIENERMSLLV